MKLYHGTDAKNLDSIAMDGLLASVPQDVDFSIFPERGGEFAAVSLAKSFAAALAYGDLVVVVNLPEDSELAATATEIDLFNEVLVQGDIPPEYIEGFYLAKGDSYWLEESQVSEAHVVVGPVKYADGYAHVVDIERIEK